jgi:hypothetical protein
VKNPPNVIGVEEEMQEQRPNAKAKHVAIALPGAYEETQRVAKEVAECSIRERHPCVIPGACHAKLLRVAAE